MLLETIGGNLPDAYKQLQPGTMLHADELLKERRDNPELRDYCFHTADGAIYFMDKGVPTLLLTRRGQHPVLKHIDDAYDQIFNKDCHYVVLPEDLESALQSPDTLVIPLPSISLTSKHGGDYLVIGTDPNSYNKLNIEGRRLAERLYGQGEDFVQNMNHIKKERKRAETRIHVFNPDYVRKFASKNAIARTSCLDRVDDDLDICTDLRGTTPYFIVHGHVRGVRKKTD
ncbi:MAG: hypothetical protein AABX05_04680 [Nanoarchaeota archaeon]